MLFNPAVSMGNYLGSFLLGSGSLVTTAFSLSNPLLAQLAYLGATGAVGALTAAAPHLHAPTPHAVPATRVHALPLRSALTASRAPLRVPQARSRRCSSPPRSRSTTPSSR